MVEIPNKEKLPFYAGLKILVIDPDLTVLQNIEKMCTECHYRVTTCSTLQVALDHVRDADVILVEVAMPNVNENESIQHLRQKVETPIIAMSNDDSDNRRVRAFVHGASNYVKKPLHEEHIRYLWHPVMVKAVKEQKLKEKFGNLEEKKCAANESPEKIITRDRRNTSPEDFDRDGLNDHFIPQAKRRRRVVWDKELHNKFLEALDILGVDKAVPKKILEIMNVPGLTRENVASHLQKYRHQCKGKLNEMRQEQQQQNVMQLSNTIPVAAEFTFPRMEGISHVPYQAVSAIQPLQWTNYSHAAEQGASLNHPITKCPSNMSPDDPFRYNAAFISYNAVMRVNNSVENQQGNHINSVTMNTLQQQQQGNGIKSVAMNTLQQQQQQQQQPLMQHHIQINPASVSLKCNFGGNSLGVVHGFSPATPISIPQQGLSNVALPVTRSSAPVFSATQFPLNDSVHHESFNLGYDANEICIPTKPTELENESSEED